jgi:hypothetical protein
VGNYACVGALISNRSVSLAKQTGLLCDDCFADNLLVFGEVTPDYRQIEVA